MKVTRSIASLMALGLLSTALHAQITNGSFESGVAYPNGPNIFVPGTPAPWFATSFTPDCYDNSGADGWGLAGIPAYNGMFAGMVAKDGHRFLGFAAGVGFNEAFKQNLAPLTPGATYTVSAFMAVDDFGKAAAFGGPYIGHGAVEVRINGATVGQFSPNTVAYTWEARSVSFVAPNANAYDVEFVALPDPATGAPSYLALDDVKMVPEPGALLACGAGLVALLRRRARR